jgi:ketosteroid isomerase-like protein
MANIKQIWERGDKAFNAQDAATMQADMADDVEIVAPGGMVTRGKAQALEFLKSWWEAYPDAKTKARRVYTTDDAVIEEGTFTGTHKGVFRTPAGDIQPTGRRVEGDYISVFSFRGEKIASQHLMFDRLQLLEQLGLVPTPAAATR